MTTGLCPEQGWTEGYRSYKDQTGEGRVQEGEELPVRVKEDKASGVQKAGADLRDALGP